MDDIGPRGPKAPRPRFTLAAALLLASTLSLPCMVLALVQLLF